MAQAAERPVQAAVPEPHGNSDVRADLGVTRDREVGGARIVQRVANDARQAPLEHALAIRLDQRDVRPDFDAERVRITVGRLDDRLAVREGRHESDVHVECRPCQGEHALDRLARAVQADPGELGQAVEPRGGLDLGGAHAVLPSVAVSRPGEGQKREGVPAATATTVSSRSRAGVSFVTYRTAPASRAHCLHCGEAEAVTITTRTRGETRRTAFVAWIPSMPGM